jgi:insertion element IS1 protein InsB
MIVETTVQKTVYACRKCHSENIVKNGKNACGNQQYKCKDCGCCAVLQPKLRYSEEEKARILAAYRERPSMRGIERISGVARQTLAEWLKRG